MGILGCRIILISRWGPHLSAMTTTTPMTMTTTTTMGDCFQSLGLKPRQLNSFCLSPFELNFVWQNMFVAAILTRFMWLVPCPYTFLERDNYLCRHKLLQKKASVHSGAIAFNQSTTFCLPTRTFWLLYPIPYSQAKTYPWWKIRHASSGLIRAVTQVKDNYHFRYVPPQTHK